MTRVELETRRLQATPFLDDPKTCVAQLAKYFISTKANVELTCEGCAVVWRKEHKGK